MTGAYRVVVQNRKIKFDFEIRRNITILRGDSATGKTTLVEMIREYEELGPDSGIELQCEGLRCSFRAAVEKTACRPFAEYCFY